MFIVTAVCHAQGSGVIFLGFQSGEVFQFNPKNNRILAITTEKGPIISLATDTEGTKLVVLSRKGAELNRIGIYSQATGFRMNYQDQIRLLGDIWLAPNLGYKNDSSAFAFCCEDRLEIRDADIGLPISRVYFDAPGSNLNRPKAMFWLPTSNGELVLLGKNCLQYVKGVKFKSLAERYIAWKPFLPKRSSLVCPQVAWYWGENKLELAGVNSEGLLTWIEVFPHEATDKITLGEKRFFSEPVRAFAFTGFRNLAAVRSESVDFLRVGQEGKTVKRKLSLPFPDAVACFANGRQQLLSVICINGLVAQVEY